MPHHEKIKIKATRYIDQILKNKKNIPGVGNYKLEQSWER